MGNLAVIQGGWPDDSLWQGWSRFVPRLSWRDAYLLGELPAGRPTAVAKALAQAGGDAQLVLQAHREPERRVVLEPEAWHNQRPPAARSRAFRALGEASLQRPLDDPATLRSSSPGSLVAYTLAFINAEDARGADALLPPYHLAGGYGRASRDGELHLAETAVNLIRRERIHERSGVPKPLLLGIAVDASGINAPVDAVALARSYASLNADGYWVQFAGLTESSPVSIVANCSAFLFALQELSHQRVFAVDIKNLVWPLLASGLFGGCIGIGEREAWMGPDASSNVSRRIKPTVVHRRLLRNFVATGSDAARAFREYPCECGVHEPDISPTLKPAIRRHTLRVRLEMAQAATSATAATQVETWLTDASWVASELVLDPPRRAAYRAAMGAATDWRSAASE